MRKVLRILVNRLVRKKDTLKQVVVVRIDLGMTAGKMIAQACHASVEATLESDTKVVKQWQHEGMRKVILKVRSERELLKYANLAKEHGFVVSLIVDAGLTQVARGTRTAIAIGPAMGKDIDMITGKLSVL